MANALTPDIYISYAWGGERCERLTDLVESVLRKKNYNVKRDRKDIHYKDNIDEFQRRLGRSSCIVVIISDSFLKSKNCMLEMLYIEGHEDVWKRIFPIVLDDARGIYEDQGRLSYLNYWKEKADEFETELNKAGGVYSGMGRNVDDLDLLRNIQMLINTVSAVLTKMNALTAAQHEENNFSELIEAIEKQMAENDGPGNPSESSIGNPEPRRLRTQGPPTYFIGREEQLKILHEKLTEGQPLLLINGMGGIGKTSMAQAYVNRPEYSGKYRHIAWLSAEGGIKSNMIRTLAPALNLDMRQYAVKDHFLILRDKMGEMDGPNLLVIDNANEVEPLRNLRGELRALGWSVLITSRCEPDDYNRMQVDQLDLKDARTLFLHHFSPEKQGSEEMALLDALLEKIYFNTLLIELLAKAGRKKGLSIGEIKERIDSSHLRHEDLQRDIPIGDYADMANREKQGTIYSYLLSLFDPLALPRDSQQLLGNFGLLPPENIPLAHLKILLKVKKKEDNAFENHLDELAQSGWLDSKITSFKMHPLLADVVREKICKEKPSALLMSSLSEILQGKATEALPYLPYAIAVVESYPFDNRELALLCGYAGEAHVEVGYFEEARRLFEKAGDIFAAIGDVENTAVNPDKTRGYL